MKEDDIMLYISRLKKRYNAEISRALRLGDIKALQRAQELRKEGYGFQIGLEMVLAPERAKVYTDPIKIWLSEIYD